MAEIYLDHNVPYGVAAGLRFAGHTVVTAKELGYALLADDRHLWVATRAKRILLTHDKDLRRIHFDWERRQGLLRELPEHYGIVLVPAYPIWSVKRTTSDVAALIGQQASLVGECYEWDGGAWGRVEREGSGDEQ